MSGDGRVECFLAGWPPPWNPAWDPLHAPLTGAGWAQVAVHDYGLCAVHRDGTITCRGTLWR